MKPSFVRQVLTVIVSIVLSAPTLRSQTNFFWTNTTTGVTNSWSAADNWTNDAAVVTAPPSANYTILNFFTPAASYVTTNPTAGFNLNQLNFSNAAVTILGQSLVFTNAGAALPQVNQFGASNVTIASAMTLATNTTFGGTGTGAITLSGIISGTGQFIKTGPGQIIFTMPLGATNTYSGGTVISGGTLTLGTGGTGTATCDPNALGTGAITLNTGGTLKLWIQNSNIYYFTNSLVLNGGTLQDEDGRYHFTGPITVGPNGGTLAVKWDTKSLFLDGVLSGSAALTIVNLNNNTDGVHFVNPSNTYSGTITVNGSNAKLDNPYALSNAIVNLVVANNGLQWGSGITNIVLGGLSGSGNIANGGNLLQVGNNNSNTTYGGNLSGTGGLTKLGTGVFTLTGTNTYTGPTTINNGTLALGVTGSITNSAVILVGASAVFDVSARPAYTVAANQTLAGTGIVTGNVTTAPGGNIVGGNNNATDALTLRNDLTLATATTNYFDLAGASADQFTIAGTLTPNNARLGIYSLTPVSNGTYTLINYTVLSGPFDSNVVNTTRKLMTIADTGSQITLTVTGTYENITWLPTANANWDLASTNWYSSVADRFYDFDTVTFDDTGAATATVNIATALRPLGVTVNSSSNYTFTGSGKITGNTSLLKTGSGLLTIANSNDFTGGVLINAGVLRVANNGALGLGAVTVAGELQLSNAVTIANAINLAGTLRNAAANNTVNGKITVTGDAAIQSDTALLTLAGGITNIGYSLTVGGTGNVTINSQITGAGSLTKNGGGTLTLGNNGNTLTGGVVINEGVLNITVTGNASASALGAARSVTINSNAVLRLGVADALGWYGANPNTLTINGGTMTVAAGVHDSVLNFGVTLNGGAISSEGAGDATGNYIFDGNVTTLPNANPSVINAQTIYLRGGGSGGIITFNVADGAAETDLWVSAAMSQAIPIVKTGAGLMLLSGTNSYSGATTINAGTLALGVANAITNTPTITVAAGATFDVTRASGYTLLGNQRLTGNGTVTGDVTVAAGAQLLPGTSGGVGMLTFGNNLTLNAGNTNVFDIGTAANDLITVSGTLSPNGSILSLNLLDPLTNGSYRLINAGTNLTGFSSTVLGNSTRKTLTLTETATTVDLNVSGSYASLVWNPTANANWDLAASTNWLNGASADRYCEFDTVNFTDAGAATNTVTLVGTLRPAAVIVNSTSNYTFTGAGKLSGPANLTKSGTGTLTLGTANDFTGGVLINAGIVQLTSATGLGLGDGTITANGTLWINVAGSPTITNRLAGSGLLKVTAGGTGANTTTLSGDLSGFTGTLDIYPNSGGGGKVSLSHTSAVPSASATVKVESNATLYLYQPLTYASPIQLYGGTTGEALGQLRVENATVAGLITLMASTTLGANSGVGTITAVINDAGSGYAITKLGAGTIVLAATNTYGGDTTVSAGTLRLGASDIIPDGAGNGNVTVNGTLDLNGFNETINGLSGAGIVDTVAGGVSTLTIGNNDANSTFAGVIRNTAGSLSLVKIGNGTIRLNGRSTFTGGTTINSGTLQLNASGSAAGTLRGVVTVNSNAVLESVAWDSFGYNGNGISALNLNGGTLLHTTNANLTLNQISINLNGGTMQSSGGGYFDALDNTLLINSLANPNPSVIAGRLNLRSNFGANPLVFNVADGAAAIDLLVSAQITQENDGRGIAKTGNGLMMLTATNTYSGPTLVSAGTLVVNGRLSAGTVTVTGGTLGGTGFVNAALINGGRLSPGNSVGTMTVGNLTLTNLPLLVFELGATNASDLVIVTNALAFTGMETNWFSFTTTSGFGVGDYTLFDAMVLNASLGAGTNFYNIAGSGLDGFLWLDTVNRDVKLTVVPEPGAGALVGIGLLLLMMTRRWRGSLRR